MHLFAGGREGVEEYDMAGDYRFCVRLYDPYVYRSRYCCEELDFYHGLVGGWADTVKDLCIGSRGEELSERVE